MHLKFDLCFLSNFQAVAYLNFIMQIVNELLNFKHNYL